MFSILSDAIVASAIALIERGWVPSSVVRMSIRQLIRKRLHDLEKAERKRPSSETVAEQCLAEPIAVKTDKANEQHYEVPTEFFKTVLGPRLKYSSCYFAPHLTLDQAGLAQAELDALELTCAHADLQDGMRILELGCGWGSLTLTMAQRFPHAQIVAVSSSKTQRDYIMRQAEQLGVAHRLEIITSDVNQLQLTRTFDRIVSVEMFEHMRNYEMLLQRISQWLAPAGKLFIHIFCHRRFSYFFEEKGSANWMGRYFFSGGLMPSVDLMSRFDRHLHITQTWVWDGTHYSKTCRAWINRMHANRAQILPIFQKVYGTQANRWWYRWLLFFEAGAELFGFDEGKEWQVAHLIFEPVQKSARTISQFQASTS